MASRARCRPGHGDRFGGGRRAGECRRRPRPAPAALQAPVRPVRGSGSPVRPGEGRRRWRALDLGTVMCFLESDAPRVACPEHGPTVAQVPWARHGAGHTREFDDQAAWLVTHTPKTAVSELMRIAWRTVGSIIARVVADGRAAHDPFDGLYRIGVDEISSRYECDPPPRPRLGRRWRPDGRGSRSRDLHALSGALVEEVGTSLDHARPPIGGRLPGVRRRPGPAEHLARSRLRPQGVLLSGRQGARRGDHRRRAGLHRGSARSSPRGQGGAPRGRGSRRGRSDHPASAVDVVGFLRLPDGSGRHRRGRQPRAPGARHPRPTRWTGPSRGAPRPHTADASPDPGARGGRRLPGGAAHPPGPGHGRGDGAGRAPPLRGPRSATLRSQPRRAACLRRRGQGRPPADRPGLRPVLRHRGPVPARGASPVRHRSGVRRAEGTPPGAAPHRRRARPGGPGGSGPLRARRSQLPPAPPYLPDPAPGGGHGARGRASPGRTPVDRVDSRLPASGQRLAGRRVPPGGGGDRGPERAHRGSGPVIRPLRGPAESGGLVEAFAADLVAAGLVPWSSTLGGARSFLARFGGPAGFASSPMAEQLGLPAHHRRFASWLMVTGRMRVPAVYLAAADLRLGHAAANYHASLYAQFVAVAADLGTEDVAVKAEWSALAQLVALHGAPSGEITAEQLEAGGRELLGAFRRRATPKAGQKLAAALHRLHGTLFHIGVIDVPPRFRKPDQAAVRAAEWAAVAPRLSATAQRYVDQLALSLRPSTVRQAEATLRELASFLAREAPEVRAVADIRRHHIEAYKSWLARRPTARPGQRLHRHTIRHHLSALRCFFERISEWGCDDAPAGVLVFAGDLPVRDEPLPRFLDDAASARLLRAARADPDPFVRLVVELLARTGLRKGELMTLAVDAVVQIGSAYWLRVPLGKLHNDRYIPLHPQLKELLDEWLAERPECLRSNLVRSEEHTS